MEFFRIRRDIPFMRYALIFNVISLITFLVAVASLATKGLHLGVDFTGGTVMELSYQQPPDLNAIRERMIKIGFSEPSVQNYGTSRDVLVRLPVKEGLTSAKVSETVMQELRQLDKTVELRRVEFVGPQVGKELLDDGFAHLGAGKPFLHRQADQHVARRPIVLNARFREADLHDPVANRVELGRLLVRDLHHRAAGEVHAEIQPLGRERHHRDQERDERDHVEDQRVAHERDVAPDPEEFHRQFPALGTASGFQT